MRSLVGMFLLLFCAVDLETSNGLIPAARELMMLNRLLNIGINMCFLVLRQRGSMVLKSSRIINASGILWSTPTIHISGGN